MTLLVTSRQSVNLEGEREFPVEPLLVPSASEWWSGGVVERWDPEDRPPDSVTPTLHHSDTPATLSGCASVQLFVDRAQAARTDFQVTTRNAAVVARLCQALEGIPLALELAAARALVMTPAQMLAQLDPTSRGGVVPDGGAGRFDFLVSRRRDAIDRHRTMAAAVAWSYRLLPPDLQRIFRALSVFRGGWTVEAADAVCVDEWTSGRVDEGPGRTSSIRPFVHSSTPPLDALTRLRENSLVLVAETDLGMRFRMLETLREFGEECLEAEEKAAARRRHAEHFLGLAESAKERLQGEEQREWLDRLEAEHENLLAALEFHVEGSEGHGEAALRFVAALYPFWATRGHVRLGGDYCARALARPDAQERTATRADALSSAGRLAELRGDYQSAEGLRSESLAIARELGDQPAIARCLHGMGQVANERGEWERARCLCQEALAIRRAMRDERGVASCLATLGQIAMEQDDCAAARQFIEESLAISRKIGDRNREAGRLNELGLIADRQGDYATARQLGEQSLAIFRELRNRRMVAGLLHNLGDLARLRGDYTAARARFEQALALNRELGNRSWESFNLGCLGMLAGSQGDYATARTNLEQSLLIQRELGLRPAMAISLHELARYALRMGDLGAARSALGEALSLSREMHLGLTGAGVLKTCAELARAQQRPDRAARLLGAMESHLQAVHVPLVPGDQAAVLDHRAPLLSVLGEEALNHEEEAGAAMNWAEAVEYALEGLRD